MKKLFPIAMLAVLLVGCSKGTESTSSATTIEKTSTSTESGAYDLKINVKKGEVFTYVMNIEATSPSPSKMEMTMNMGVADVAEGKIKFETKITGMNMDGATLTAPQMEAMSKIVVKTTMDERGTVLESRVEGSPDPNANSGSNNSVSFPDKPVKPGDKWTGETEVSGKKLKAVYTFVAVETVNGKQIGHLTAVVNSPEVKFDGPLHFWVELSNGMLTKTEFSGEEVASKTKMKVTMSRK